MFDQIEQLKQKYTDKYVVVDERRPELSRFKGFAGVVKTVNMSGRALVEFDAYANVGWFDIELDYLKVVDQPPPKPAERQEKPAKAEAAPAKPKAPAPAGEKKLSPLEAARAQGPVKKPGEPAKQSTAKQSTGKQSTADILAAARGGAAPAKPAAGEKKPSTAEILAAARTAKGEAPASKPAESAAPAAAALKAAAPKAKLSTSDILAAARKNAAAAASAPSEAGAAPVAPSAASSAAPETAAAPEEASAPAPSAKPAKAAPAGGLPTGTAEIIAWCRQRDAK